MPILRPASTALAAALASGVPLNRADLFTFTLADNVTVYNWTTWRKDQVIGSVNFSSRQPWLKRGKWNVANTMEVPSLAVDLLALNDGFAGGANIKTQIHNGLFDGASVLLSRVYMPITAPDDVTSLGTIGLFGGVSAGIDVIGSMASLTVKGKNNRLDQYAPRNNYQIGCNHAFCDVGCTLSRTTFTSSFTVGSSPTSIFVPWGGTAPGNASNYIDGTLAITSGSGAAQRRSIVEADSTGLTLAYPLYETPSPGDTFTAFQGCDKSFASGSGRSCTDRSNTQHYRGYEFVPPPNTAY